MDFKGEKHCTERDQSTTDPDALLYKKGDRDKSSLYYLRHALMENRNGLVINAATTLASDTAELQLKMSVFRSTDPRGLDAFSTPC